jgi:molybdopterin-guanine dinucleotide biosynthesis protein A
MPAVYGLVLAGGASRRMQRDKAELHYHHQPQLQRAVELLQAHCVHAFVSVRADQQQDALRARWSLIVDGHADAGPLAGIAAAQALHPDIAWLVIACDLPQLDHQSLNYLLQQRDPTSLATAFRGPVDQQPEPLCAIWEPASAEAVRAAIAADQLSLRKVLKQGKVHLIDAPEPAALNNVNTPEEHQRASAALAPTLSLQLQFFALFREQAGKRTETLTTAASTPAALYAELQQRYGFKLNSAQVKVAVNNEFCDWQQPLKSGDSVAFIPPVAGG